MVRRRPKRRVELTKERAQFIHARNRARTRYGLHLTEKGHAELVRRIEQGTMKLIGETGEKLIYDTDWCGKPIRVAFDPETRCIATFLYRDVTMYLYEMVNY